MTVSSAIEKALPAAEGARRWRPSTGNVYRLEAAARPRGPASHAPTPAPDAPPDAPPKPTPPPPAQRSSDGLSLERAADEALLVHVRHGGEYMDENPITGRPGEFHLSSTGRKAVPPPRAGAESAMGAINGLPPAAGARFDDSKDAKADKTPKSAMTPRPRRRKSKMSNSPTPAQTPAAS